MKNIKRKFEDSQLAAQQYVLGQMSESDTEEFESYFLSKPEVIELVEVTQELHFGLKESSAMATGGISVEKNETGDARNSIFGRLAQWLTVPIPAFAVIALAVLLSPLMLNGVSLNNSLDTDLASNVELINFSTTVTRSSKVDRPTINLSGVVNNAALLIKVKSVEHREYKLKLLSGDGSKPVWVSKAFQVSALRDYLVTIPKLSVQEDLSVDVVGINADSSESSVAFCHYSEVCN